MQAKSRRRNQPRNTSRQRNRAREPRASKGRVRTRIFVTLDEFGKTTLKKIIGKGKLAADAADIADALIARLSSTRNQADIDIIVEDADLAGFDLLVDGPIR